MITPWEGKETRKRPGGGGNAFAQLFKKNSGRRGQEYASVYGREGEIKKKTRTEKNFFLKSYPVATPRVRCTAV